MAGDWGEIRTKYIWELIQQTSWDDTEGRKKIGELMLIEEALYMRMTGRRMNRVEELYTDSLIVDKYPDEAERIESELTLHLVETRGIHPRYVFGDAVVDPDDDDEDLDEFFDELDDDDEDDCADHVIQEIEQIFRRRDEEFNSKGATSSPEPPHRMIRQYRPAALRRVAAPSRPGATLQRAARPSCFTCFAWPCRNGTTRFFPDRLAS